MKSSIKHWWLPITIRPSIITSTSLKIIVSVTLLEFIVFGFQLSDIIQSLYKLDEKTGEKILTNTIAIPYQDIVISHFYFYLIGIMIIGLMILPLGFFYQHYVGSKSIYTMLRIKEKKIRISFYLENVAVSLFGMILIYLWQLLLFIAGYPMYAKLVPKNNQPLQGFKLMWKDELIQKIFPINNLLYVALPICILILLPTMTLLAGFVERSKRSGVLGGLGVCFGIFAIYAFFANIVGYVLILPLATIVVVFLGIFYVNKVQIV